jgi:hypothetical protein
MVFRRAFDCPSTLSQFFDELQPDRPNPVSFTAFLAALRVNRERLAARRPNALFHGGVN